MKFLDQDWCGFQWTDWIPLTRDQGSSSKIPSGPGLCRVKAVGDPTLFYIGQTGGSLKDTFRALGNEILSERMPSNPHVASPCLRAHRLEVGMDYEISATPQDPSRGDRMAIECFLLWQYRVEKGSSPPCNHVRSHPRSTKERQKGTRKERPEKGMMNIKERKSHPPLLPSGSMESLRWMGLDWSEWKELDLGNIQRIPTQPGVYRIYDHEELVMLYLGGSRNLRKRIQSHSRRNWGSNVAFSFHSLPRSLPEYQRMEIENDLIGGYYLERVKAPRFQFEKK